jgi:hypothetical protein
MKALWSSLGYGNVTHLELRKVTFDSADMMECFSRALWNRPKRPLSVLSFDMCQWTTEEATCAFWQFWQHPTKSNASCTIAGVSACLIHTLYLHTFVDDDETPLMVEPDSTPMSIILHHTLSPANLRGHPVNRKGAVPLVGSTDHCTRTIGSTLQRLEIGPSIKTADVMAALTAADVQLPALHFKAAFIDEDGLLAVMSALPALLYLQELQLNCTWISREMWAIRLEEAIRQW